MTQSRLRRWLCAACTPLAMASVALAQPTIDGTDIPNDFTGATVEVIQRFQTQWGDNTGDRFHFGGELDRMFITNDDDYLYIGLTGNLENNGNNMTIFIDVDGAASGAPVVATRSALGVPVAGLPRFLTGDPGPFADPGLNGLAFDAGFAPDFALGWSGGSPRGSQTRTYYLVNWSTLAADANDPTITNVVAGMMTDGDPTASGVTGTLGNFLATGSTGILGASDNSNGVGVDAGNAVVDPNLPPTATKGFEFAIPLTLLGVGPDDDVCVFVVMASTGGYVSQQMLPTGTTETTLDGLGFSPDLATLSGDQFACYTIVGGGVPCIGDIGGAGGCGVPDGATDLTDLGCLLGAYGPCP